jgi:hypothetical protein
VPLEHVGLFEPLSRRRMVLGEPDDSVTDGQISADQAMVIEKSVNVNLCFVAFVEQISTP